MSSPPQEGRRWGGHRLVQLCCCLMKAMIHIRQAEQMQHYRNLIINRMHQPTILSCDVTVNTLCCLHYDGFTTLVVFNVMAADCSVPQHAHTAHKNPETVRITTKTTGPPSNLEQEILRKVRLSEGRDKSSDVDGNNGDDDTGQEDGSQFVHIFNAHKDQQGHQDETDASIDSHVVQHCYPFTWKNSRRRYNVLLQEKEDEPEHQPKAIHLF